MVGKFVLSVLLFSVPSVIGSAYAQTFLALGDLPGGDWRSYAMGVSANGRVVCGWSTSASGHEAFRWTREGGIVGLGDIHGAVYSEMESASWDGSVLVGTGTSAQGVFATMWTPEGSMVSLGDLPGGDNNSSARRVSPSGEIVVGIGSGSNGFEAFRWSSGTGMVGLGDLPGGGTRSDAFDLTPDGTVIVGQGASTLGLEAYRWTAQSGMLSIGAGANSTAKAVSTDGSVIAGTRRSEAFRWVEGQGLIGLGDLPGGAFSSTATDMNADGSLIVGQGISAEGFRAFIWDASNGMRDLKDVLANHHGMDHQLEGWTLFLPTGISDDGRVITGNGVDPEGRPSAWVAIIPTPGSASIVAFGLVLACRRRRRRECGR